MSKKRIFIIIFLMFFIFIFIDKCITTPNNIKIKIAKIQEGYKGLIVDKYAVRNTKPTHLKILIGNNKKIRVIPNRDIVDAAKKGDSLIKIRNENIALLKTDKGKCKRFFYTRLSYQTRNSKYFPDEWKDRWLESSEWDKNNKK